MALVGPNMHVRISHHTAGVNLDDRIFAVFSPYELNLICSVMNNSVCQRRMLQSVAELFLLL